ncbi:tetratricopeptide repeat protein [Streptomyces sp. NPDC058695]|uniref:tetratricopeptide repeat protein n=1 Tax=Streptomyces sp. NPDC058695 TaxID=3346604 RepID=UPI003654842E
MSIGFGLLGDMVIRSGKCEIVPGPPRQRCVLALVLVDVDRPLPMDTLIDHGDGEGQAATRDTLGHIAQHTGRTERALHSYGEALTHFQSIGNANREADTWSKLGDIHAERGEDARAREAWTTALALYREQGRSAPAHRMTTSLATGGPG